MLNKILRSPIATALLGLAAVGLILMGGINTVRAAPAIVSEYFGAQVELTDIETALLENGEIAEGDDDLLVTKRFLEPNELHERDENGLVDNFKIGKTYDEKLAVRNVGTIDQYVRVTVRKYWETTDGKRVDLDPKLIDIHFVTDDGWTIDEDASTPERTVLYYDSILGSAENSETGNPTDSSLFADKITISSDVFNYMTGEDYDYENVTFRIEAQVDAVQTHSDEEAMRSAWGRTNKGN